MKVKILSVVTTCFLLLAANNCIFAEAYPNPEDQKKFDEFRNKFIKPLDDKKQNKEKENCLLKKEGPIKIANDNAVHKLIVKTNSESCKDADIIINITPETSFPVLYDFKDNLSLISRYKREDMTYTDFVNDLFNNLTTPVKFLSEYEKQSLDNEPYCKFFVTEKYHKTIIKNKYPIFCHRSYEEGEICIVYIPALGQMIKVAICGT